MIAGDVVVLNFPFSDLSGSKLRPAVVLARVDADDFIACQITSKRKADRFAVELTIKAFAVGGLRMTSFARPGKLFTASPSLIAKRVGRVKNEVRDAIRDATVQVIRQG